MIPGSMWDTEECQRGDALSKKPTRFLAHGIEWTHSTVYSGIHKLGGDGS